MAKIKQSTEDLLEMLQKAVEDEYGPSDDPYNPLKRMAVAAENPGLSLAVRAGLNKEVAQYVYAKKKAMEVTGMDNTGPQIYLMQFSEQTGDGLVIVDPATQKPVQIDAPSLGIEANDDDGNTDS